MPEIKLITLDLDGTLLTTDKRLTPENEAALRAAAEAGIEIVPATGRYYGVIPESLRTLPYIHYVITVNGAQVYDVRNDRVLARAELPWQRAVEVMTFLDAFDVIYDCYMDNQGWITRSLQERAEDFALARPVLEMVRSFRSPVPELKAYLAQVQHPVQKVMIFFRDPELRLRTRDALIAGFPDLVVTSSVANNLEVNAAEATKGKALLRLAAFLGLDPGQTMAFGDDINDVSMLRAAGIGVAMGNASPEARLAADETTLSCDENGVAAAIRRLLHIE